MKAQDFYQIISGWSMTALGLMNVNASIPSQKVKDYAENVAKLIQYLNEKKTSAKPFTQKEHFILAEHINHVSDSFDEIASEVPAKERSRISEQITNIKRQLPLIDCRRGKSLTESINDADKRLAEVGATAEKLPDESEDDTLSDKEKQELRELRERRLREANERFFFLMAAAEEYKKNTAADDASLWGMQFDLIDKLLELAMAEEERLHMAALQRQEEFLEEVHQEVVKEQEQFDTIVNALADKIVEVFPDMDKKEAIQKIKEGPVLRQMLDQADDSYAVLYDQAKNHPDKLFSAYCSQMGKIDRADYEDEMHEKLYDFAVKKKNTAEEKILCKDSKKFQELMEAQNKKIEIAKKRVVEGSKKGAPTPESLALVFAERLVQNHLKDMEERPMDRAMIKQARDYVNNTDYEKEMAVLMKDPAFIKTLKEVPNGTVDEGHVEDLFKKFLHEKSGNYKMNENKEEKKQEQQNDVTKKEKESEQPQLQLHK